MSGLFVLLVLSSLILGIPVGAAVERFAEMLGLITPTQRDHR